MGADSIYVVVMALGLGVIQWVFLLTPLVIVVQDMQGEVQSHMQYKLCRIQRTRMDYQVSLAFAKIRFEKSENMIYDDEKDQNAQLKEAH